MINVTFYTTHGHEITLDMSDASWDKDLEAINQEIDATTDGNPFPPQDGLHLIDNNGNPSYINNVYAYKVNSNRPDHAAVGA